MINLLISDFSTAPIGRLELISLIAILGFVLLIRQPTLLEESSGMYLSAGGTMYLLPAFPLLLLSLVIELSFVSTRF